MGTRDWITGEKVGRCWHIEMADDLDETMVDLGGGMIVPLRELMDDDDA